MTNTEAMKLALEALEKIAAHPMNFWIIDDEITALRTAIAEAEKKQQQKDDHGTA